MKQLLLVFLLMPLLTKAQDSALTFSKVIEVDSLSKDRIYDKALIWCSQKFNNSNYAIRVSQKESGLIGGKAFFQNTYKIPGKKDSTIAIEYFKYDFDWLIEIKDNKLRFTVKNIELKNDVSDIDFPVTTSISPPYYYMMQTKSKGQLYWKFSKIYFLNSMDDFAESLRSAIEKDSSNW